MWIETNSELFTVVSRVKIWRHQTKYVAACKGKGRTGKATHSIHNQCSVNSIFNKKVDYKRSELPVVLEKVKELFKEQDNEIEKALIGHGKYEVNPEFIRTEEESLLRSKKLKVSAIYKNLKL